MSASRSYEQMIEKLREAEVLISALFELTYRCNLDCYFCYNDLSRRGQPMETEDWCRTLDDLAAMGALEIGLSGGEPMVYPGFWDVARHATDLGMVVRVKTNGHLLDEARSRRLADEIQPFLLEISLHGARAETHERQTRIPGSFDRLLRNLKTAREAGLRVQLKTALTRWNETESEEMMELAERLDCRIAFDVVVTPRDDGDTSPLVLAPSDQGVRSLVRVLESRRSDEQASVTPPSCSDPVAETQTAGSEHDVVASPRKSCGTGSTTVTVDPFGNVFPCVQWRRALGNLHQRRLPEIWSSSPALAEVRRINREAGAMLDQLGEGAREMGFCLGLAEEATGDPLSIYPQVARKRQIHLQETNSEPLGEPSRPSLPVFGQDVA